MNWSQVRGNPEKLRGMQKRVIRCIGDAGAWGGAYRGGSGKRRGEVPRTDDTCVKSYWAKMVRRSSCCSRGVVMLFEGGGKGRGCRHWEVSGPGLSERK